MNTIKHYILSFYNSYIKRFFNRNALIIELIIILFILGFFAGKAYADEPKKVGSKPEIFLESSIRIGNKNLYDSTTTTTTTTTTAPYKKPQKTVSTPQVSSSETSVPVKQAPVIVGDWVAQCHAWASQAGIELTDAAIKLIGRESKCNPNAQNPTSSACGIAQNIRGCDSPGYGYDPVQQLVWFKNYCFGRYGSFEAALQHSYSKGWY